MSKNGTTPVPTWAYKTSVDPSECEATMMEPQQPHTTTIAHFASAPNSHPTGSLLDVSVAYVAYAVKGGLVRVIDRRSALRTLLRGHSKLVTDIAFFGSDASGSSPGGTSDVLGTVGGEGDCSSVIVWRIFDRENELASEKLLEIRYRPAARLVWHPFNPNQFLLLSREAGVCATMVESTRIATVPHETEGHAVCLCTSSDGSSDSDPGTVVEGGLELHVGASAAATMNDLSWSGRDARHVLSAHMDGCVRLWDLRGRTFLDDDGQEVATNDGSCVVSAKCIMTVRVCAAGEGTGVGRCFFLSRYDDAAVVQDAASTMEPGSYLTAPFMTAHRNNSCIMLWSPFSTTGSPPSKVRVFSLESSSPLSFNVTLCTGNASPNSNPPSSFVTLADRKLGRMYAVHLQSQWRSHVDNQQISSKMAVVTGFDHMTPFRVAHPIYSCKATSTPVAPDDVEGMVGQFEVGLFCVQSKAVQLLSLRPGMLVAPTPLSQGDALPPGMRIESVPVQPIVTDDDDDDEEEYEVSDDDDDDDDDASSSEDETDPVEILVPPPGLQPTAADTSNNGANPFANWLGAIASKKVTSDEKPPPVPVSTERKSGAPPPGLPPGFGSIPSSGLPGIANKAEDNASTRRTGSPLLSPADLMRSGPISSAIDKTVPVTTIANDFDMNIAAAALPASPKETKNGVAKSSKPKNSSRSPTPVSKNTSTRKLNVPSDGKVTILKREDKHGLPAARSPVPAPPNVSSPIVPLPSGPISSTSPSNVVGLSKVDMEDAIFNAMSSHSKKNKAFITSEIERAVKAEMNNTVVPALSKMIAETIEKTVTKPLQVSLTKASKESTKVRTKEVVDAVSLSVKAPVTDAFNETMRNSLIPAFDAATREMFSQISVSLDKGIASQSSDDKIEKLVEAMALHMSTMAKSIDSLSTEISQLRSEIKSNGLATTTGQDASAPVVDAKEVVRKEILGLLEKKNYEAGFTKALSASTIEMAVFACRNSDVTAVLGGNTPSLSQPILLCLMQQLGAAIASSGELDLKLEVEWLQEIALTLNPEHESIRRHVGGILKQLVTNINAKISESDPTTRRTLQMLQQVLRGMGRM